MAATEPFKLFVAPDRSFRLSLPADLSVRVVEAEDGRAVWSAEGGRTAYLFGYATIPRAATMAEPDLRGGLDVFATGYQKQSGVSITRRNPVTQGQFIGLQVTGTGTRGVHRALFLAVGPRIYTLATDAVPESESRRFWSSFQPNLQ